MSQVSLSLAAESARAKSDCAQEPVANKHVGRLYARLRLVPLPLSIREGLLTRRLIPVTIARFAFTSQSESQAQRRRSTRFLRSNRVFSVERR